MKLYELRREALIPGERAAVFAFFSTPENLAEITPPSVGFQVLTPSPIRMRESAVFDYTVRAFGLPVRWTTLIDDYDPPHGFSDVQLRGPYSYWHHSHVFQDAPGGATRMTDHIRYVLPFGVLGRLAAPLVRRQLKMIFDHRERVIAARFPARPG